MYKLLSNIKKLFKYFGFRIHRNEYFINNDIKYPSKVLNDKINPRIFLYHGVKQPIVINVPMKLGLCHPNFSLNNELFNPYIFAVKSALRSSDIDQNLYEILKSYYKNVQPQNLSQLLDIPINDDSILSNFPPWASVLPWDNINIEEWMKVNQKSVLIENHKMGKKINISDGWAWSGPVSDEKLRIEVNRYLSLLESIMNNGYLRDNEQDGDILVDILYSDDTTWKWQATTGQHRAIVLSSLEKKHIPVRIKRLIERKDVNIWPNVVSGLYSSDDALKLFDRIFKGEVPSVVKPWLSYLK